MHVISSLDRMRAVLGHWRARNERIGLVPTMGNLHEGHLDLVRAAARRCDRVVVSLFVNPTQFGPGEDYQRYPRTRAADLEKLGAASCDLVWTPDVETMYPLSPGFSLLAPPALSCVLCGEHRPGHFDGVANVVLRLFQQVRPQLAVFGEKDFQQLLIIKRLVQDLALAIEIQAWPTRREADGLAMSSRNQYLNEEQRVAAPQLYASLMDMSAALAAGEDWPAVRDRAWQRLEQHGFTPQYLAWRSAEDLGAPQPGRPQRLLAAAVLGPARLIDNLALDGAPINAAIK
ncbi:MAG: pantoate--beta-alanine ligase [Wenzhouxiangellaceae bacterium]|nr:MAG: pantoate--beta-alanine ligase [Wenzhouxiangellaceae bacterium]